MDSHFEQKTRLDFEKHLFTVVTVMFVMSIGSVSLSYSFSSNLSTAILDLDSGLIALLKSEVEKV